MSVHRLACLLLCLSISGCATGPKLAELQSSMPQLSAEQGRIFFYRPSIAGGAIQPSILVNGDAVGTAKPNGFFFVDVPPGPIEISITTESQQKAEFTIQPRQARYVRVAVGFGFFIGRFYPQLVAQQEAEAEMADLAYSGPELSNTAAMLAAPAARAATPPSAAQPAPQATAAVASAVPAAGSVWSYSFRDRVFGNRDRDFSVRTIAIDDSTITEIVSSGAEQQTLSANPREIGFQKRRISGEDVVELSPYLLVSVPAPTLPLPQTPRNYPGFDDSQETTVRVTQVRHEEVIVPAGRFETYRVTVRGETGQAMFRGQSGNSSSGNDYRVQRFEYDAWYAPQIGRYVQTRHRTYTPLGTPIGDEWIQLKSFVPRSGAPADKKD